MQSSNQLTTPSRISGPPELEVKYACAGHQTAFLLSFLDQVCIPDPKFPTGIVSSIYYDTADWDLLREKRDSDYLKTKVRLRWYESVESPGSCSKDSLIEAKLRIGSTRSKIREKSTFSGSELTKIDLQDSALLRTPSLLLAQGLPIEKPLYPAFIVRYTRYRFVEPTTQSRICVDFEIHAPRTNPAMLAGGFPCHLHSAVLEVKGHHETLPVSLLELLKTGLRRQSFSKYFECYRQLTRTLF